MQPFDSEFIREQRELAEKATPRPWETEWNWDCDYVEPYTYAMWAETPTQRDRNFDVLSVLVQADQAYMTAACNTYPLALTEIERLQAELAEAKQHITELSDAQHEEVNQFNLGHDAFFAGEPSTAQPHFEVDYDVWTCGWAWGKFLKEEGIGGK